MCIAKIIYNLLFWIVGPLENVVGHPLHCSVVFNTSHLEANCPQSFNGTVSCVTLLYRRFKPTEMSNSGDIRALHSLQWLPVFVEGKYTIVVF